MKFTIIAAIFSISLPVAGYAATSSADDHPDTPGIASTADGDRSKPTSIPETGAVVLGLVGAMLLLRRRRL